MEQQVRQIADKYLRNVKPSGFKNYRAECPFHKSKSSSRSLYLRGQDGSWTCFSCPAGGSLPYLLYKLGLTRTQVDRILGGMNLPPPLPGWMAAKQELNQTWKPLPEYVLAAYDTCPLSLLEVGFTEETLQRHDVGYDAKNDRITFAIRDYLGLLVAVSGRAYEDYVIPKYRVYDAAPPVNGRPAGAFFGIVEGYIPDNRRHLYGYCDIYASRYFNPPAELPPLLVVEGFKACLWPRQLGFDHTVALMGDNMSRPQERLLNKLRGPYYVMLDYEPGKQFYDRKGRCGAVKIAERLSRFGQTFICQYPQDTSEGISPDDLTQQQLQQSIENALTLGQYTTRKR